MTNKLELLEMEVIRIYENEIESLTNEIHHISESIDVDYSRSKFIMTKIQLNTRDEDKRSLQAEFESIEINLNIDIQLLNCIIDRLRKIQVDLAKYKEILKEDLN